MKTINDLSLVLGDIVCEVGLTVNGINNIIDAKVGVLSVSVSEFHTNDERIKLEVVFG